MASLFKALRLATPDYPRLAYRQAAHHIRFVRYVAKHGMACQNCSARGGEVDPVTDEGYGPWIECGWCEGTGKTTPWLRGVWLSWRCGSGLHA